MRYALSPPPARSEFVCTATIFLLTLPLCALALCWACWLLGRKLHYALFR